MKAIYFTEFKGPLSVVDIPIPEATRYGVVIKVEATGLCRSDWHAWMGHDSDIVLPHVPGHEFAGVISEIGSAVTKFKVGDRVTVPFVCGCGKCTYCLRGDAQVCPTQTQPGFTGFGSFAEYVAIDNADFNLINIPSSTLELGDIIRVETNVRSKYRVEGNSIVIDGSVNLNVNDDIQITWFSQYPTMNIITDEYAGGKLHYQLPRDPLNINYVWVYKNGIRLTSGQDYSVSLSRLLVYIKDATVLTDEIRIIQFGTVIYKKPQAYEIFKDMLNVHHYKRYSIDNNIKLSKNLNYYDRSIEVTDSTELDNPVAARNIPGIIEINGEKIE